MTIDYPLKTRQVCFFILAFLPITKIFSMPSIIAKVANEDMWISVLFSLILDFITLVPIVLACKKANKGFFEILQDCFGKFGCKVILFLYLIFFTIKVILPLNEQKDYVDFTLYTLRPSIAYFLPFFIVAFYLCFKRLKVLGRISDIMWMISINGLVTLFVLSITNADFSAILPVGARGGLNILNGTYQSLNWFGDCVYLLFFIGEFKYEKRSSIKIFLSFLVSSFMILIFMIIFYCIFTSIAFRQRFALTEISKYTTVINNLGRFDYIGIIMILFSNMFALCLPMFFSAKILNYMFNFKKKWIAPLVSVGTQLIIMLVFNEYYASIQTLLLSYGGILFILLGNVLPIIISIITLRRNNYAIKES